MTKSKIFLVLSSSFILGIFLASNLKLDAFLIYALFLICVIIITLGYKNKIALMAGLAILFLAFGIWRTQTDLDKIKNINLDGKNISEIAIVIKEPEEKNNYKNIVAKTEEGMRVLLRVNINSDINYGDELKISCTLKIPENKEDFDYKMYLAKDSIFYLCQNAKFEKTGNNLGNKIYPLTKNFGVGVYAAILRLKNKMEENVNRVIPYPHSALANGLIFGGSSELPENLKENFSRTGMTHIVAVSGYNVSIIAEYLIWFFIFIGLWRKQAFWVAVLGIILFVAMIGFPSSAVRAGVMGTLLIWAAKNGRLASSWNAIIFAGAVMLLINPLLLRWDIGFQLSFLATIGIISLSPLWEKYLIKNHKAFGFTEIFFLTLSAQIFVLPIILYNFHALSLVSLAANLLILLIVPISMLLIFLSGLIGIFSYWLALPFAWLAFLPLKYETWAIDSLASLSRSSVEIKNFLWWHAAAWYAALALLMYYINRKQKIKLAKRTANLAN